MCFKKLICILLVVSLSVLIFICAYGKIKSGSDCKEGEDILEQNMEVESDSVNDAYDGDSEEKTTKDSLDIGDSEERDYKTESNRTIDENLEYDRKDKPSVNENLIIDGQGIILPDDEW